MKNIYFLLLLLICSSSLIIAQTIHIVDNNQGSAAPYTNVQDAVDAAADNDIIYIQPSPNSYGSIQMTKPLKIYGLGYKPELNSGQRASVSNVAFRHGNASGSEISGLNITEIYLDNTTFENHDVVITNNRIRTIFGNGSTSNANNVIIAGNVFITWSFSIDNNNSQNWIISNNLFAKQTTSSTSYIFSRLKNSTILSNNIIWSTQNGDTNQSISVFNACNGTQISNNIFLFTGTNLVNMNLGSNSALSYQNNLTYSLNTTLDALSGSNNIDNTDPQFVAYTIGSSLESASNDFNIQTSSPAENAGTDGNNLGVYNGLFPFSQRGYPTELPYLTDFVIFNNIISPGETLDINIKANANIND
ncbi:hypothetical protein [Winogradskyella ouciana]|uniref:hypothetical protein n=1 Tax=Winogradskyella ouciana TaxID=2608631 RepID=UPI003D285BC9